MKKVLTEQEKEIALLLISFYEVMKSLENDIEKEGKKAIFVLMTMSEIMTLFEKKKNN